MKTYLVKTLFPLIAILLSIQTPISSQNIPRPNILAPKATGVAVNSLTGNLYFSKPLFQLPARGMDIELQWVYNSTQDSFDWGYGHGWTHTYNQCYWQEGQDIVMLRADGRIDHFTFTNGAYHAPKGIFDTLEYNSNQVHLTTKYGEQYFFDDPQHKKLTKIQDRNSNTITLEYANKHLAKVKDPTGQHWLEFSWTGNHCTAVADKFDPNDPRAYGLTYNGDDLLQITDPLDGKTVFAWKNHLLERITDENGNETAIEYNAGGAATKVTSCLSRQTITYNIASRRTYVGELVGGANQITTYEYDAEGRNTSRKGNCCGYNVSYTYDKDLNVTTLTDGKGYLRKFEYDGKGNAIKETDQYNDAEMFKYNNFSLILTQKDKKGNITTYEYDGKGNLTNMDKPEGVHESYEYDAFGNTTTYTDGNQHTTHYSYDDLGNITAIVYPTSDTVQFIYDLHGNRLSEKDGNEHITTYQYDKLNRLIQEKDAIGGITRYAYDARGNRMALANAKNDTTTYKYDGLDRLVEIKAPMNLVSRYTYDSRGNVIRSADPRGAVTQYEYDDRNLPVIVIDPLLKTTIYSYDDNGNRTSVTDPNGNTTSYEYDALDRLIVMYDALQNKTTYSYDKNDNLIKMTDANDKSTEYTFDGLNRQMSMKNALGHITRYEYDDNDNLVKITDANNHSTTYQYDGMNRVIEEKFADGTTKEYKYDDAGNVVRRKDNSGILTEYQYDQLNRLIIRHYPNGKDGTFTYDPLGQMTEAKNPAATVTLVYDAAGRLLSETLNGKITAYSYNAATGKRVITYPSGRIVEEFYDKRNQLTLVKADAQKVTGFEYDAAGRLIAKTYGNNAKAAYIYDNTNRVIKLAYAKGTNTPFVDFEYAFDKVGNKLYERKLHHPTHSEKYGYDDTYRLTGFQVGNVGATGVFSNPVTQTIYDYDPLGNRNFVTTDGITTTYAANEMNEYTQIKTGTQTVTPEHDNNGNLIWDGDHHYTYDDENRLIAADNGATVTYTYDALGRRIRKEAGGVITNFYFDGFREIEERDGADNVLATYVFGTWIDDVLQMKRGGDTYFYHANSLGSVVALTDTAGEVVERYQYEGYGGVHFLNAGFGGMTGSVVGNKVLFTGRRLEIQFNCYDFRTRDYSPKLGLFLTRDRIGYNNGMNLYFPYFIPNLNDPYGEFALNPWTVRAIYLILFRITRLALKSLDKCSKTVCCELQWHGPHHLFEDGSKKCHFEILCFKSGFRKAPPLFKGQFFENTGLCPPNNHKMTLVRIGNCKNQRHGENSGGLSGI